MADQLATQFQAEKAYICGNFGTAPWENEKEYEAEIFRISISHQYLPVLKVKKKSEGGLRQAFGELAWNDPDVKCDIMKVSN